MLPSPFIVEWLSRIAPGVARGARALDVAMGRGRHAIAIARAGFRTFGVDIALDAIRDARGAAAAQGVTIAAWCADLTASPLPRGRFDLVVVTRYLQRDLFPSLCDALAPGGVILYETFTTAQRAYGVGPRSPDHLLRAGELRDRFLRLDVLFYDEVVAPEALARIAARRRR